MATIVDVAKMAGVSTATVSRAFNGMPVSQEKVVAIREAAEKLNFVPNRTARSLRRRRSEVIALVIPDVQNPYFTDVARGVEDVASESGYSLVLCNSDDDVDKEKKYLQVAAAENMVGVVLAAANDSTDLDSMPQLPPVVAIDRSLQGRVDEILMDNVEAGRIAAAALLDHGRRYIVCVTGPETVSTARDRSEGSIMAGASETVYAGFNVDSGRDAMLALLDRAEPPDGVIAANNLLGVGVLQALSARGLSPKDVGVSVIGSLPFTTLDPGAVSIVQLPSHEMGRIAAQHLIARVTGTQDAPSRVVLTSELHLATTSSDSP